MTLYYSSNTAFQVFVIFCLIININLQIRCSTVTLPRHEGDFCSKYHIIKSMEALKENDPDILKMCT